MTGSQRLRRRDLSSARPFVYGIAMSEKSSPLDRWTPEQLALAKRWVETWRIAGEELERIRRQELRRSTPIAPFSCCAAIGTTRSRREHRARLPAWWNNNAGSC